MQQRKGLTLVECLMAIFVMSIGLLGLMSLLPVGAAQMRDALVDSRAAQASANASSIAIFQSLRTDPTVLSTGSFDQSSTTIKSRALYVDPAGASVSNNTMIGRIPRCAPSYATNTTNTVRWFSMLDDIPFDPQNGLPTPLPTFTRESRYTWAYMLRQPDTGVAGVIDLTVVVYGGRSIVSPSPETTASGVVFTKGSQTVTFTWSNTKPDVPVGGWILDATGQDENGQAHGFFYRVANVTDLPSNQMLLDLQTPIRLATNSGTLVMMENVAGVFEKGEGHKP